MQWRRTIFVQQTSFVFEVDPGVNEWIITVGVEIHYRRTDNLFNNDDGHVQHQVQPAVCKTSFINVLQEHYHAETTNLVQIIGEFFPVSCN